MNTTLHDLIVSAYQQADRAYTEAIKARAQMDDVVDAIPVEDTALYRRACALRELSIQAAIHAAKACQAIDELMGEV